MEDLLFLKSKQMRALARTCSIIRICLKKVKTIPNMGMLWYTVTYLSEGLPRFTQRKARKGP